MAVGTVYQGAWQQTTYQGAWQMQGQALSITPADSFSIADSVVFGTDKIFSEAFGITDGVVLAMGKVLSEIFGMSDAAALSLAKVFADSLAISDSILITPGITFNDAMSIGDAIVLEFGLNVTDQQTVLDSLAFDFGMNLSDAFDITDTFLVGTALYFSDSLTISDTINMIRQMGIDLSDVFSIGDSVALMFSKSLSEAMGLGDNVAFAIGKNLSETFSISDAKVLSMGKGLSDIVSITDALYNALTVGEQIVGLKRIAEVLANAPNETQAWMPYIGIGSSDIEGDEESETTLWTELHRKLGTVTARANTYFIRATFGQDEPTGDGLTIKEVGIFDAASGGNLGKRWVLANDESKDNIDEIVVECAVTILHGSRTAHAIGAADGITDSFGMSDSIALQLNKGINLLDIFGILEPPEGFMLDLQWPDPPGGGVRRVDGAIDLTLNESPISIQEPPEGFGLDLQWPDPPGGGVEIIGTEEDGGRAISIAFNETMTVDDPTAVGIVLTPGGPALPTQLSLYGLVYTGGSEYVFCNGRRRDTGEYGIVCFDCDDKANPVVVSWLTVDQATYGRIWYDVAHIVSGGSDYLLCAAQQYTPTPIPGGVLVVDITDELNPTIVDRYYTIDVGDWDVGVDPFITDTYHIGLHPSSPYIYIAIPDDHADMGVQKVNITTPSNLFVTANWNESFFDDGYPYLGLDYSLFEQWDGVPLPPVARWWAFNGAYDAKVAPGGNRVYVASGGRVWQFDHATFGVAGAVEWVCDTPGNSQALYVDGTHAMTMYTGDYPNNFKRLVGTGIGGDRDPVIGECLINIAGTWMYNRIQSYGDDTIDFAVAASSDKLEIINVNVPSVVSSLSIAARQGQIETSPDLSEYLYVAAYTEGLYIYNVDDKASPVLQSQSFGWWS